MQPQLAADIDPTRRVSSPGHLVRRRSFLVLFAGVFAAACSPAPVSAPTAGPVAKPTTPAGPTAAPAAATASQPTTAEAPAAKPTAAAPTAAVAPTTAPATSSGPATIPFYTTESDPNTLAFYKQVADDFKQQHKDVDVKVTVYQDETQLQFLTTAFQTGTDLGIFAPPSAFVADWASKGFLQPLDPLIQKIGPDDFLPGTLIPVGGKQYGMPFQANASALWYRKDLFDQAGLKPPTTYAEFLAAAQALNKEGTVGIASTIGGSAQMALQFFAAYIHQAGWDYYDRQGNVTFDKPEVLDAVKRYVDIMKNASKGMYNAGFGEILNTYIAGKAAMATFPGRLGVNTEAKAPDIAEKSGVIGVPAGPFMTGKLLYSGIQHYVVSSKTASPDAAMAYLQFLASGENELNFAMSVPGHLLPPLNSLRAKLKDYKSDFMTKHSDWVLTLADLVPTSADPILSMGSTNSQKFDKISNTCPWASDVWGNNAVDNVLFQEILIQGKDPEVAWKDASAKLKQVADTWKSNNPSWKPSA
jgi:multiple sugar transport system substrate-binding protein